MGSWFLAGNNAGLVRSTFHSDLLGLATALVAALFGFVDYSEIRRDHVARTVATRHLVLNVVAPGLFAASAWLRRDALERVVNRSRFQTQSDHGLRG